MTNLCMVGTGSIATQHMKAFRQLGGVEARWAISRSADKAREFGREWKFERTGADL